MNLAERLESEAPMTGGAFDFSKATVSLTEKLLTSTKKVTLVRHGLSSWNEESRVQVLTMLCFILLPGRFTLI